LYCPSRKFHGREPIRSAPFLWLITIRVPRLPVRVALASCAFVNQERAEPIENSFGVFVNRVDVRPVHSTSKPAGLLRLAAKNFRQLHVDLADRDRLMKYPYLCL